MSSRTAKSVRDPADARLHGRLGGDHRHQGDQARSRPEGRRRARLPGRADAAERGHARGDRPRDRHHARARRPPRRRGARDPAARQRPDLGRPAGRQEPRAREGPGRHDRAALPLRLGAQRHRKPRRAPINSLYEAVKRASQRPPVRSTTTTRPKGQFYLFRREQDAGRRAGLLAQGPAVRVRRPGAARATRSLRVPPGTVVLQAERPENLPERHALRAVLRPAGQPRAARHRHQGPAPGERPDDERADRHVPLHRQGPEDFQDVTRRLAERGQTRQVPGQPVESSFQTFAIVLDRELVSRPFIDYRENPDGIDGRTGAQISGGFNAPGGAGPRRRPEDRRAADRPEADQRDPGLRLARQAGAARGPAGRRRRLRARAALPDRSSTACWA